MAVSSPCRISSRPPAWNEQGGVLLATLVVTMLATLLVMSALYETGVRLETRVTLRDGALARTVAQAGLEDGARMAFASADWRNTLGDGPWLQGQALGDAVVDVDAADPQDDEIAVDGALGSSSADSVRLTATARRRGIGRTLEATFVPFPHAALRNVAYGNLGLELQNVALEGRVRSNGNVTRLGAVSLHGDITTLLGGQVSPDLDDADTDIAYVKAPLPLPAVDFDWFQDAGERITLPANRTIANKVITSTYNPYGAVSPDAIYWIDAGGGNVYLYRVAAEACLVIRHASQVVIGDWFSGTTHYYHHSPAPDRLPALLVEGDLTMRIEAGGSVGGGGGLNPALASDLEGVIYCTGALRGPQMGATDPIECEGAFIANDTRLTGPGTVIRHRPELNLNPLAGLAGDGLRLVAGSTREP